MGIRLDLPRVLCLLTPGEGGATELPDARAVAGAFVDAGATGVLATALAEGVVVIAEVADNVAAAEALAGVKTVIEAACARIDRKGELLAGISTICRQASDYERGFAEARQVISCLSRFGAGDRRVLAADDLGAGRLLLSAADPTEIERFARDTLGRLLGEGDGAADLVATLAAFFDEGRSIRKTAAALDVHENTIRYRLGRIEEAIGLPIATDSDAQLTVHLALLVLRLQGRL
jgi:DNA-binding PucR family transcriptional regulator